MALVTEWWVKIRGETNVIHEKRRIAEMVGERWNLNWSITKDEKDRPDVICLCSRIMRVSMLPPAFENLRDTVGRELANSLENWVSIAVMCNIYELHCHFETQGAEAIL